MKRKFTIFGLTLSGLFLAAFFMVRALSASDDATLASELHEQMMDKAERKGTEAEAYQHWLNSMRANPKTGKIEEADVLAAREQMREYYAKMQSGERGGSLLNLQWENFGPNNVGGRTRIILIDRNNPNRIYAGGASGGLYYTDNAGLDWHPHPQNDEFSSLLICAMGQAANGDIYFGTGEYWADYFDGSFGSYTHGFAGDGMYKAAAVTGTDLPTFSQLTATIPTPGEIGSNSSAAWAYVNRVTCSPTDANTIVAATNTGLKITTDGGTTWANCTADGSPLTSISDDAVFDSGGFLHAISSSQRKYYRSVSADNPSEMSELGTGLPTGSTRRVLAVAPSDNNYVYIYSAKTGTYGCQGIFQSTDHGDSFTQISEEASDFFNPNGTSANITWNLCIAVKPDDAQRIYIGGQIQSWTWNGATGSWTPMTSSGYPTWYPKYIHADQHWICFDPVNPNIMYYGSDGGISRTLDANDQYPDFGTLNKGLNFYQSHGIASGIEGDVMGGAQDNGTHYVNFELNSEFQGFEWLGGDGGKVEISKIRPEYLFGTYFSVTANGNGAVLRRSVNAGASAASIYDCNIDGGLATCAQDGLADGGTDFVTPFVLWENYDLYKTFADVLIGDTVEYPAGSGNFYVEGDVVSYDGRDITLDRSGLSESRLFHAVKNNLWLTTGALFNSTEAPEWFKILPATSGYVSAIEYDKSGDIAYVGTENGKLYRLSGLLTANYEYVDVDGNPETAGVFTPADAGITTFTYANTFPGKITGISINRDNPDQVAISIGGFGVDQNVWYSSDALANDAAVWDCISDGGKLPNIPAYDVLLHVTDPDKILIATEFGIWSYSLSSGADWTQENTGADGGVGPGNVPVFEIREDFVRNTECYAIYIGTHGNGYYRATNLAGAECDFHTVSAGPIQEEIIAGATLAPNPADTYTNATFTLTKATNVSISIVNLSGVTVRQLPAVNYTEGAHTVYLDVRDLPAGTYLVVFDCEGTLISRKLSVI